VGSARQLIMAGDGMGTARANREKGDREAPSDPSVLITGCSSGIGLETAVHLAHNGWRVFASMRDVNRRSRLEEAMREGGSGENSRLEVIQLDVTDRGSISSTVGDLLVASGGALDAVVHNAGVNSFDAFENLAEDEWHRVFDTNFFGVLALTQALLPSMRARRRGRIVLVSSLSAFAAAPAQSIYTSSKAALNLWAASLAYEVQPFGIHVSCVEPGAFRTNIWKDLVRVGPSDSVYEGMTTALEGVAERVRVHAQDPRKVARTISQVLEADRPRLRYPVGVDARVMSVAHRVLPQSVLSFGVRRLGGLHSWHP
jgi:NAD(P)-dependent dehydrogenase (short-subunit alcohol dehydrogenase family)